METETQFDGAALESRRQTLLAIWKEAREHARQHEAQRATATNMILLLASGDIAAMVSRQLGNHTLLLAIGLIVLGIFGFLLTAKHYERTERWLTVSIELERRLDVLDEELRIGSTKEVGFAKHFQQHPLMTRMRLNKLWSFLHLAVLGIGVYMVTRVFLD